MLCWVVMFRFFFAFAGFCLVGLVDCYFRFAFRFDVLVVAVLFTINKATTKKQIRLQLMIFVN